MKLIELHLPQNLHVFKMVICDGHTRNDINWQATHKACPQQVEVTVLGYFDIFLEGDSSGNPLPADLLSNRTHFL